MKLYSTLLLLCFSVLASAQIGGISGTKVASFCYNPIAQHALEFEPTFGTTFTNAYWNDSGDNFEYDSTAVSSSINWRITYGLFDKLELGMSAPSNVSSINLGAKGTLLERDLVNLAGAIGLYMPLGNGFFNPNSNNINNLSTYGIGLVSTVYFDDNNSLDVTVQYQDYFTQTDATGGTLFINADFGAYVFDKKLALIMAAGYQSTAYETGTQSKLTLYPGISIETGKLYGILISTANDVFGKNMQKTNGFFITLTTFLN